jgi:hypothetical protein
LVGKILTTEIDLVETYTRREKQYVVDRHVRSLEGARRFNRTTCFMKDDVISKTNLTSSSSSTASSCLTRLRGFEGYT